MKKWMLEAGLLGLLLIFACNSNSPAGPTGDLNPPGPNPSPTYWGTILEIEDEGTRFKFAAHTGEILNVRTDNKTQISREENNDSILSPADLREGDKAEIDGIYQGSQNETIKAEYIYLYKDP
ncbi:MAG TPA: hypothetical protein VNL73_07715 [Verrucomicrobiae bacterium]|nr:hypothetical protein [Verrucomicrobiae bacterium]